MRVTVTITAVLMFGGAPLLAADAPTAVTPGESAPCSAPRLTRVAAIRLAMTDLKRRKWSTDNLEPPMATCLATDKGKTWSVYFHDKKADLDGCFWIFIDDRSGKVDPVYGVCG
jgi:hypothetical protein